MIGLWHSLVYAPLHYTMKYDICVDNTLVTLLARTETEIIDQRIGIQVNKICEDCGDEWKSSFPHPSPKIHKYDS